MLAPELPEVETLADRLGPQIAGLGPGHDAVWQVSGPPTAGKTALLAALAEVLETHDLWPITVSPPSRALDAGPSAVVEIAGQLQGRGAINGQLETIIDPQRKWRVKLDDLRSWLEAEGTLDRVVLLFDEPETWFARSSDDVHFAGLSQDVISTLLTGVRCRRVVTGRASLTLRPGALSRLSAASRPHDWLLNDSAWGELADVARRLWARHGDRLSDFSPLQIRLLVALTSIDDSDDQSTLVARKSSRREISRRLAAAMSADHAFSDLTRTWASLALVRRSFDDDVISLVGGDSLEQPASDVLRHCLLYRHNNAFVLHDTLKIDAANHRWLRRGQVATLHRELAGFYANAFQETSLTPTSLTDSLKCEMEAFHHAASSADPACLQNFRPFFVTQLDALGRHLSRDAKRYREAADVFHRAIAWDENDDYAHHYLAFNLDVIAEDAKRVEDHFARAIELNPTSAWWHSRYICFLATRGRSLASEKAWDSALDALGLPDPEADPYLYENLHLWVARLLLHRGQLEFAGHVLNGIPGEIRARHPGLKALYRRLRSLEQARRTGVAFPLTISPDRWWQGPHLCPSRHSEGGDLTRWLPGRIDGIEDGHLELFVADPPEAQGGDPRFGHLRIAFRDFDRWTGDERARELAAGHFVELGFYGSEPNQRVIARVHRETRWEDPDLPPLFPDPTRYLSKRSKQG